MVAPKDSKDIKQALKLCNSIANKSIHDLQKCSNVQEMTELRDAAQSLANHLNDTIVQLSPCKYDVTTVVTSIDSFRHYKFKKFSGLCGHNLGPILENQVGAALRAEEGMLAIQMLIPIIDFFNEWSGRLDDSYGEGGMFVSDWGEKLDEAISLLPEDDEQLDEDDLDVIEEILESMEKLDAYGYGGDVEEAREELRQILDGNRSSSKRARLS